MKKNYFRLMDKAMLLLCLAGIGSASAQPVTVTLNPSSGSFSTGTIGTFTVPSCVSSLTVDVRGAQGGYGNSGTGGLGARMMGVVSVTPGQVFSYLVGRTPGNVTTGGYSYPAGGGGSFFAAGAAYSTATPVIVAGGGGAGYSGYAGDNGTITTTGTGINPGTNGNGAPASSCGGGGGGFYSTGGTDTYYGYTGGLGFQQGGTGGIPNPTYLGSYYQPGGFGGGAPGDYYGSCNIYSGAGGGYSGGSGYGTSIYYIGAGGGSYNSGTSQSNTSGYQSGDGLIIITYTLNGLAVSVTPTTALSCLNSSITLTANGASSYTWSSPASNSASVSVSPSVNTTYTVSGTNSTGCTSSAVVIVTVSAGTPTLSLAGTTPSVCLGAAATLSASGALTYSFSNSVANGGTFTPSSTASYTITGTNGCGSTSTVTTISVAPLPVMALPSSTLVCSGTPATLTAGGAANYTWTPGANNSTVYIVNPASNTTYTVNGKTGVCTGSTTVTISTKPNPTLSITPSSTTVCNGNSVNLGVSGNAMTYTWNPGGQTGTSISVSPTTTTLYSATGTNSVSCVSTVNQVIVVYANPVVNAAVSNAVVCSGGSSTLTASGADTYAWSNSASGAATIVNPTSNTSYTATGTSTATGCYGTAVVSVSVFQPTVSISSNVSICSGSNVIISASGADTYQWANNGSNLQAITVTPSVTTIYTVTGSVTDPVSNISCPATNTTMVTVNSNPTISATANHTVICIGNSAILTADGAGTSGTYTWTGGSGAVHSASMSVSPIANQTYSVAGTDANGCNGSSSIQLHVSTCTGINSLTANTANLVIYPNPSNGEFTITSDQNITLQVINELGQQVKTIMLNGKSDVKVNDLANGVYFIMGSNANGSVKQKIVIAK